MSVIQNPSFVRLQNQIKSYGIEDIEYLTEIKDKSIEHLDPHSPYLSDDEKVKITKEALNNIWYFMSKCVLIPMPGGYESYKIHLTSFESICAAEKGLNVYTVSPRQQYGTGCWIVYLLWNILKNPNYNIALLGKNSEDDGLLKEKLVDINGLLPDYMRMDYYELRKHFIPPYLVLNMFSDENEVKQELFKHELNNLKLKTIFFDEIEMFNYGLLLKVNKIFKYIKDEKPDIKIYTKTIIGEQDTMGRVLGDIMSEQCPRMLPDLYNLNKINIKSSFFMYINNSYTKLIDNHKEWYELQKRLLNNDVDLINREILCTRNTRGV